MRFQMRDAAIIASIYEHDGILAQRHLREMFWPNTTLRAAQKRLSLLVKVGYLNTPTPHQRRTQPIPEVIYWLGWKGILWHAGQQGIALPSPIKVNEYRLRELARSVREAGLHWLREPRWNQLGHDLAVIDIHLSVKRSVRRIPSMLLDTWQYEFVFRSDGDQVSYRVKSRDGSYRKYKRYLYPDSYFELSSPHPDNKSVIARSRFLLEIDNATHSNPRFGREKVAAGLAYLRSAAYRARFGANSGRWLMVTTGKTRMRNLMKQTRRVVPENMDVFYYTTIDQLLREDVLTDRIWHLADREDTVALF